MLVIIFGGIILFHLIKSIMIKRFFATYEPPPVTVSSVLAVKKDWKPTLNAVGNFVAINGVEVNSEAAGNVVQIYFDSGQSILSGKPLINIDDSIEQASLKFSQADMALKQISYERQTNLYKRGATSSSTVDEAKANLDQAKANVEKIQAQINQKHITAPFSGLLGIRQVNLGQYITPGKTSIVTLQSLDPLYVEFNLPEQMYKQLYTNQKVYFKVEEFDNILFEGKISAVNPKADPGTHNILVQASLPNCPVADLKNLNTSHLISVKKQEDNATFVVICDTEKNKKNQISKFSFIPGMFTAIAVALPPIKDVVILPSTAISYSLYGNSVYVIEKESNKNDQNQDIFRVKRQFVNTGDQSGNDVIIQSGIQPGEIVVSSGELKLQNGTRVIINNDIKLNAKTNLQNLNQ